MNKTYEKGALFPLEGDYLSETSHCDMENNPLHYHDHFELELVIEGTAKQTFNNMTFDLNVGDVFLCRPIDSHSIKGEYILFRHIKVKEKVLPMWILNKAFALQNPKVYHLEKDDFEAINNLMILTEKEINKHDDSRNDIISGLIDLIFGYFFSIAGEKNTSEQEFLQKVSYFIQHDNNFRSNIKLDDIAKYVGYSKFYTSSMFHKISGQTIQEFIIDKRIEYAKSLLLKTDYPVCRIVDESGFGSTSNFYSQFIKKEGCSPIEYKEKNR